MSAPFSEFWSFTNTITGERMWSRTDPCVKGRQHFFLTDNAAKAIEKRCFQADDGTMTEFGYYAMSPGGKSPRTVREPVGVPPYIDTAPVEGSRPTRMRPTNERGEPIATAEPFPVRWDDRLGAYVRA